ncbi:unnamed protein product [Closterium sp. NIES-53]
MFLELAAFATVEDLASHLCTSDARYHSAAPAEFLDTNQPPMFVTLYFIVTRLPDSLRSVKDHFLSLYPTVLTIDLLEQHLLAAETSVVAIGAARGTPRTPFFEGCSPSPLAPSAAAIDVPGVVAGGGGGGAAVEVVEAVEVVAGVGALVAAVEAAVGVTVVAAVKVVAVGLELSVERGASGGSGCYPYVIRTGDRAGQTCGKPHIQHCCFSRLDDTWHAEFGDEAERPRWAELLRSGVAIFDLDYDIILAAMYALSVSAEGDRYQCVLPDPCIEADVLGASESVLPGTAPAEALHTFTLDSGASRCFFRDNTTLTPLSAPVPVRLADPSGGRVLARSSTVLPCPAVPSGSLSGLHLPLFSTNLVIIAPLQDVMVTTTTPEGQHVAICTCTQRAVTWPRSPIGLGRVCTDWLPSLLRFSCGTTALVTPPCHAFVACTPASLSRVFPGLCLPSRPRLPCPAFLASRGGSAPLLTPPRFPRQLLPCKLSTWTFRLQLHERFHADLPILRLHSDRRGEFSSDLLRDFFGGEGILHRRSHPSLPRLRGMHSRLLVSGLPSKGEVPDVLIPWIRAVRLQLRERFRADLPILRLLSDRGDSPQQNGIAERRIGLVMEVARTSMIHAAAPHFLWPFAVRYAAHQLNLWPRVSLPKTSPTLRWTGKVGDASVFRVWGSHAFVRDTSTDKLSARAIHCVFLGFSPDVPGWQFYHPTSRRVFPTQDVTFDESVTFYRLFPYRSAPPPPPPLFLAPGPPPVDPLLPQGPAPFGVSQVDPLPDTAPVDLAVGSGAARSAASGSAEPGGAESEGVGSGGAEPAGVERGADYSAIIPPPLISPLNGAAADYSVNNPPPLISPHSGAAADYSAIIPPPLISPHSSAAADYSAIIPPPLISPHSGAAADYFAIIPPPLISPFICPAADYSANIPPPLLSPHICSVAISSPPLLWRPFSSFPLSLCTAAFLIQLHLFRLPLLPLPFALAALSPPCTASPICCSTPLPVSFQLSHHRRQPFAPTLPATAPPGAGLLPSVFCVTLPSHASILGASPLMDPRFAVPFPPFVDGDVSPHSFPTVAALSLPRTLDFVLDSGATDSVFVMLVFFALFPVPSLFVGPGRP